MGGGASVATGPESVRRGEELVGSRALVDMVNLLMSRPNCQGIAQHLVLGVLRRHRLRSAVISVAGDEGALDAVGTFGLTVDELGEIRHLAIEDHMPITDALRTGEPIVLVTSEQVREAYPWMASAWTGPAPMAAWPLSLPDEDVGALLLGFTDPPNEKALRADVAGVAAVLALYLGHLLTAVPTGDASATAGTASGERFVPETPTAADVAALPVALSPRQARILTLLAEGLTQSEISESIGFSESTVRHECMRIYRLLGVGSRREAIRAAHLHRLKLAPPI